MAFLYSWVARFLIIPRTPTISGTVVVLRNRIIFNFYIQFFVFIYK